MGKLLFAFIFLSLATIPSLRSLLPDGFFYTHEGPFQIVRLMHFYNEILSGQIPVRWTDGLGFGYGYPIFNYISPLLYYAGALLHWAGFSFGNSLKIVIFLSTFGSVFAFYLFLKNHFRTLPSITGALFYLYVPYRFSLTFVNGSVETLLALLFLPLCFFSIYKIVFEKRKMFVTILALTFAGLIVSDLKSLVMFFPLIFCYAFSLIMSEKKRKQVFLISIAGFILGAGLGAFYFLPAIFEAGFVRSAYGITENFRDHFPLFSQLLYSRWGYGYSVFGSNDGQSFQLGFAQVAVFLISLILIVLKLKKVSEINKNLTAISFLCLGIITLFLMQKNSIFVWEVLRPLQLFQYPWQLLAVMAAVNAYLAAWLLSNIPGRYFLALALIVLLLVNNKSYAKTWEAKRFNDDFYRQDQSQKLYNGSTDKSWEFLPVWAETPFPNFADYKIATASGVIVNDLKLNDGEKFNFYTESTQSAELALNLYFYPIWHAKLNGEKAKLLPQDKTGLTKLDLPPGTNFIVVTRKNTFLENLSNAITLASLASVAGMFALRKKWTG